MMSSNFQVHFDQKFVGTFDTYVDAKNVLNERGNWERVASINSWRTIDIFICRTPTGIFNYAYASITFLHKDTRNDR